jgi:DNA-binding beta-propeller fold protein YncE
VMDARDGAIVATIFDVGGSDEVWFNPTDRNYYLAARDNPTGPVLGVIDATTNRWITNIPTAKDAKSVAVDPVHGRVYVALTPTDDTVVNDPAAGLSCQRGCVAILSAAVECISGSAERPLSQGDGSVQ